MGSCSAKAAPHYCGVVGCLKLSAEEIETIHFCKKHMYEMGLLGGTSFTLTYPLKDKCKNGKKCRQKDPAHSRKFRHPPKG